MSRLGKILFFVAWISIAIVFAVRYVLGGWINPLYVPLVLSVVSLVGAFAIDAKFYLEFFTMRTTKHGLNMGTMILLALGILVTINYLAVRKNKVWDLTEDKLFSLSQQTVDVLKPLKEPVGFIIFYRGEKNRDALNALRETLQPYEDTSPMVDVEFFDTYVENLKAQQYLNALPDKDSANNKVFLFIEHEGKRERVNMPFGETEITSAIVKVTRKSTSKIYFLTGHGEHDLMNDSDEGLSALKRELEQYAAKTDVLNLLQTPEIPADATAIVIAGPRAALLDNELNALNTYLFNGGKLLVLADPGEKHNLAGFLKPLGVEFSNTYVISVGVQVEGLGPQAVVGLDFDQNSDITKPFVNGNTYTLMFLATEVRKSPGAPADFQVQEILRTNPRSMTLSELSNDAKRGELRAYSLATTSKGKLKDKEGKISDKDFAVVVFGDSDFVTNKLSGQPTNMNIVLNSIASLSGDTDLISVRPKQPKATKLVLTAGPWLAMVGVSVLLPLLLMITGSVFWFRRRSA
ncbi:MAG: GldG family protein [Bdellovibrionales bacterium]